MNKQEELQKTLETALGTLFGTIVLAPLLFSFIFWFAWTVCHVGETFFSFLPPVWQDISYFNCLGLYFCLMVTFSLLKR